MNKKIRILCSKQDFQGVQVYVSWELIVRPLYLLPPLLLSPVLLLEVCVEPVCPLPDASYVEGEEVLLLRGRADGEWVPL